MIRYFEYLYLVVAFGLVGFLAYDFKSLGTTNIIIMMVGILICSFMFSFRRKQRQIMEAEESRLYEEPEEEMNEDGA